MSDHLAYPTPRTEPFGCPMAYDKQRETDPLGPVVLQDGSEALMVTTLEAAKEFLSSPVMSTDKLDPHYPKTRRLLTFVPNPEAERPITTLDGEVHLKYRRMLSPEFTAKRINAMRPELRAGR